MIGLDRQTIFKKDIIREVENSLSDYKQHFHLTINLNSNFRLNQTLVSRSFNYCKRLSTSILNDFGGKGHYFMRPVYNQSFHYHIMLQVNDKQLLKKKKQNLFNLKKINSKKFCAIYAESKEPEFRRISSELRFKGASIDLAYVGTPEARKAVRRYIAFNDHNPTAFRHVDLAKHFAGDASFAYATSDMLKKSA